MKGLGRWRAKLYSGIGIPFILSQWTPYTLQFKGTPKVSVSGDELRISTDHSAGGFAYFLDAPVPLDSENLKFTWNWAVAQFPQIKNQLPLTKSNEDFALRVGLLISDGKSRISIPGKFKAELNRRDHKLSYVLFYCATPADGPEPVCLSSPYHDRVINCLRPAAGLMAPISTYPLKDLKPFVEATNAEALNIFAVWLFADSDNSKSNSNAQLSDLRLDAQAN